MVVSQARIQSPRRNFTTDGTRLVAGKLRRVIELVSEDALNLARGKVKIRLAYDNPRLLTKFGGAAQCHFFIIGDGDARLAEESGVSQRTAFGQSKCATFTLTKKKRKNRKKTGRRTLLLVIITTHRKMFRFSLDFTGLQRQWRC